MYKIILRVVLALAILVVAFLGGAYWAMQRTPEFYEQALSREPSLARQANDQMLENATALVSDVQREGRWEATFTADQINGWLAVDLVENYPDSLPPQFSAPRIKIAPGEAVIACRYQIGGFSTVLSLDLEIYMPQPTTIAIRVRGARAGAIPMPLGDFLDGVSKFAADRNVDLIWTQVDGDPVAIVSIPPGRDRDTIYQFEAVELRDGEIFMAGKTERMVKSSEKWRGALVFIPLAAYPLFGKNVKTYR